MANATELWLHRRPYQLPPSLQNGSPRTSQAHHGTVNWSTATVTELWLYRPSYQLPPSVRNKSPRTSEPTRGTSGI